MSTDNTAHIDSLERSHDELPASSNSRSPRAQSIDSYEEWQNKYHPIGSKRSRDEESHNEGPAHPRAPLPAKQFNPSPQPSSGGQQGKQFGTRQQFGSQSEYIQYGNPVVYISPQTPNLSTDLFRMLLAITPQDEAMCSLHISQPPPSASETTAPFPTVEAVYTFYNQYKLEATVHTAQSTPSGMYMVVEFPKKADAIRAFLLTGPFALIDGAVVKVGWAQQAKSPTPPLEPIYTNPEVMACARRFVEVFDAVRAGTIPNTSNEEWARFEEAKYRKAPTPPPEVIPTPVESTPAPSYVQQFSPPVASNNGHAPASYLPAKASEVPKPGPIPDLVTRARAQLKPQRSRVSLKEVRSARMLTEAGESIRFNRTVLQLTTAIDPLMNYESNVLGVPCDSPMFALPFADERAVYEATAQFGDINGIIFTPDKRSVFITFAKAQSVTAAVNKAHQANWIDGGVRASALGHVIGGRLY